MNLILTIRTDKPEAEIGLFKDNKKLDYYIWQADRHLSETILSSIINLLKRHKFNLDDIDGIICFKGPGSFTGLRIGLSVSNALAYGLTVPVVAEKNKNWVKVGLRRLSKNENDEVALPFYGAEPNITLPKK